MSFSLSPARWRARLGACLAPARRATLSRSGWLPILVVGIILLTIAATVAALLMNSATQRVLSEMRAENREVRIVQTALLDIETGARGYVLSLRMDYLQPYMAGIAVLESQKATLALLDQFVAEAADSPPGTRTFSTLVAHLRHEIETMIALVQASGFDFNAQRAQIDRTKAAMDTVRHYTGQFLALRGAEANQAEELMATHQQRLLILQIVSGIAILAALILAFVGMGRQTRARAIATMEAVRSREQIEHLFGMADMLQSAAGYEDANGVLRATALRLLPGLGGALYIFNNSRDRLDLSTAWDANGDDLAVAQMIGPSQCWALKRGKPHLNSGSVGALRCTHAVAGPSVLEIPMMARGELYGLLQIVSPDDSGADLEEAQPLAMALSDSMSLALSSIALRERLRNQALRDPLTGLYNRRFMEEVLESFTIQAKRRNASLSAIMIDLDHFKHLNDQHGHATGDAVLRDVAGAILAVLRKSDIACRYGGEELIVLLPDSDIVAAQATADTIRLRIAELSVPEGATVSASLGVASIPETSADAAELTDMADAALYKAKQGGRNRVMVAPLRRQRPARVAPLDSATG